MKAMIFAAGLGTRMRPLTNHTPKALVEVQGKPLLEWVIRRLMFFGIKDIIINVHYMAEQIETFLTKNNNFGINIAISDEKEEVLETGGGLKKAQWFFSDGQAFLVCNTDILCDIDLAALMEKHRESKCIATLAVQKRTTSRYLLFDNNLKLQGWLNNKSGEVKMSRCDARQMQLLAFSSFQIFEPAIFVYMPKDKNVFSTIDLFLDIAQHENIQGFEHQARWLDVGTPDNIPTAESFVSDFLIF